MFDGGGCGWGCVNGRLSGWKWILVRGYLLRVPHFPRLSTFCLPLSVSHCQPICVTILHTLAYLTYPGEKGNAPTTHYCRILRALRVFCLRSQRPRQGQGQGTSGECRIGVFYLNQGVNGVNQKGNPEISTVLCAARTILEDTYTGYGGRAGEGELMAVPDLHEILYSTTPFFVSSASVLGG